MLLSTAEGHPLSVGYHDVSCICLLRPHQPSNQTYGFEFLMVCASNWLKSGSNIFLEVFVIRVWVKSPFAPW